MIRTRNTVRAVLVGGVALAAISVAQGAFAQTSTFNIPSEDAATALAAWSAASGIKVDAPASLTRGVTTAAVSGTMDPRSALDQLIAGTKLQILADDGSQITLGSAAADTVSVVNVTGIGTTISGVKAVGSPVQRLNREDILKTGATSLRDVLGTLPSIQVGSGTGDIGGISGATRNQDNAFGTGPTSDGTTSIDIGGQGARATLVLVDGQRLAQSGENSTFTDINQIPISALGAVEVIPDGASAIYGTDAISGVVNLVIRRNYQGVSVSADYTTDDFRPQYGGAITVGKAWNWLQGGNLLVTYDSHLTGTVNQNKSPYTGLDRRSVGGNVSNVTTPYSLTPYISTSACLATAPGQVATINGSSTVPVGNTIPGTAGLVALETIPGSACFDAANTGVTPSSGRRLASTTVNYGLPPGQGATAPTLAQIVNYASPTAADPNARYVGAQAGIPLYTPVYIPSDTVTPYLVGTRTQNILVTLQQKFSDSVDGSLRLNYNRRKQNNYGFRTNNIALNPTTVGGIFNPAVAANLYPGAPAQNAGLTACLPNTVIAGSCPAVTIIYPYGMFHSGAIVDQYSNVGQLNVAMPYNWQAKISFNMSASRDILNSGANQPEGLQGVSNGAGQSSYRDTLLVNGTINPYLPVYNNPAFYSLVGRSNTPLYRPHEDAQVVLNGPLFNLPGGTVRASVLAQFSYDGNHKTDFQARQDLSGTQYLYGPNSSVEARTQTRGRRYAAEFYIPVFGEANAIPFVKEFTVDVAVNRQHLARSRTDSTDPQVSAQWKPISDLTLRGTYGTSFRAPDLSESSGSTDQFYGSITSTQALNLSDADLYNLLVRIGATDTNPLNYHNGATTATQTVVFALDGFVASKNPKLRPEKSTSITLGFDYKPAWLSGLSVSGTYRSLDYKDKIVGLRSANWLTTVGNAQAYSAYIFPIVQNPACDPTDPTTYPVAISSLLPNNGLRFAAQQNSSSRLCDAKLVLGAGNINITNTKTKTFNLTASYRFNTPVGTFNADTNWTKILESTEEVSPGNGLYTLLDYIGAPNSLRGRSSVGWSKGPLSLNVFANYVGAYTDDQQVTLNNRGVLNSTGTGYLLDPCQDRVPIAGGLTNVNTSNVPQGIPSPAAGGYPGSCRLPIFKVPSWTTFDLSASYRTNADAPYWRRNVRLSMNVNNFTGKKPPYAPIAASGAAFGNSEQVYDPANANIQGRVWNFRIEKEF